MPYPAADATQLAALAPLGDTLGVLLQQVEYRGPTVETVFGNAVVVGAVTVLVGFLVGVYRAGGDETAGDSSAVTDDAPATESEARTTGRGTNGEPRRDRKSPTPTTGGDPQQPEAEPASTTTAGATGSAEGAEATAGRNEPPSDADSRGASPATADRVPEVIPRALDVEVEYDALVETEPIGGGGNADVVRATLSTADGDVTLAVKTPRLSGTLHADAVERLLDEADTWDTLDDHHHVVGVVDYGSEPIPWIAMEYMDAGHLGARAGDLPLDRALWTALAVTKGVHHAHRRGVAHLDLKPANVLFRSVDGAWDVPKVADWGLSKHLLDHSASVEGLSPQYDAPEQFDDDLGPADDITDVYQLGALFYELFTGRPPFEGNATQVMRAVLDEQPAPPSEVADLPPALDDVLLTALATRKADRYDSVVYVRDALQELYEKR
jgi:serine/threonine protein kinase